MTGGTGTLGREVVGRLSDVRVLSRRPGRGTAVGDLVEGTGLDAALDAVEVVVHCATTNGKGDVAATRNLIAAARRAGSPHLVYVSIVGVDRIPLPYYRAKLAAERLVAGSGLPWTILRATQFHDLLAKIFAAQRLLPVTLAPAFAFQPVATGDVAARLVELAAGAPAGRAVDLGGPEVVAATDLARTYLRAASRRRPVVPLRLPGKVFAGYRRGDHLAPEHADGTVTFEQYLSGTVRDGQSGRP